VSRRTSKVTFQRPRGEGAIGYHLEEETTPVKMVGVEGGDHQRSERSPAMKVSRAWRLGEGVGEPSSSFKVQLKDDHFFFGLMTLMKIFIIPRQTTFDSH
jgi:hypothetical protein